MEATDVTTRYHIHPLNYYGILDFFIPIPLENLQDTVLSPLWHPWKFYFRVITSSSLQPLPSPPPLQKIISFNNGYVYSSSFSWANAFSALTLLVGWHKWHLACKNWMLICCYSFDWTLAHLRVPVVTTASSVTSWCSTIQNCLTFWYQFTRVVILLLLSCAKSHMLSASRRQPHLLHVSAVDRSQTWSVDKIVIEIVSMTGLS